MNEEEAREIIDNMSEQELNDFIFFALQEVEKENQKLKTKLEKKDKKIEEYKMLLAKMHGQFLNSDIKSNKKYREDLEALNEGWKLELEKKDKIIDLMSEEISKSIVNTCPFADYNVDLDCENKCKDDYKSCWKKYFERKIK